MISPTEKLSSQLVNLQKKLKEPLKKNSKLQNEFDQAIRNSVKSIGKQGEIKNLCQLYTFLNDPDKLSFFNSIKKRKEIEEINVSILTLIQLKIAATYKVKIPKVKKDDQQVPFYKRALFISIASLYALFAAVDGASVFQTIIGLFSALSSIPNFVVIPIQFVFACVAVFTFCALELNAIGKPLGIRTFDLSKVFKLYTKQADLFEDTFGMLRTAALKDFSAHGVESLEDTYESFQKTHNIFTIKVADASKAQAKPSPIRTAVNVGTTVLAACIVGILSALMAQGFLSSVLPMFLTAAVLSGPVGLGITITFMAVFFVSAALLYVALERSTVTNLVDKLWGTPKKTIDLLKTSQKTIKETKKHINGAVAKQKENIDLRRKLNEKQERPTPIRARQEENISLASWLEQKTESPSPIMQPAKVPAPLRPLDLVDSPSNDPYTAVNTTLQTVKVWG